MSYTVSKTKIGLAVIILNLLVGSHHANAAVCKPSVSGTGNSNFSFLAAQTAGKAAWRVKAIKNYGPVYGLWLKASNRTINCTKSGKVRTCVMSGNPCI